MNFIIFQSLKFEFVISNKKAQIAQLSIICNLSLQSHFRTLYDMSRAFKNFKIQENNNVRLFEEKTNASVPSELKPPLRPRDSWAKARGQKVRSLNG